MIPFACAATALAAISRGTGGSSRPKSWEPVQATASSPPVRPVIAADRRLTCEQETGHSIFAHGAAPPLVSPPPAPSLFDHSVAILRVRVGVCQTVVCQAQQPAASGVPGPLQPSIWLPCGPIRWEGALLPQGSSGVACLRSWLSRPHAFMPFIGVWVPMRVEHGPGRSQQPPQQVPLPLPPPPPPPGTPAPLESQRRSTTQPSAPPACPST